MIRVTIEVEVPKTESSNYSSYTEIYQQLVENLDVRAVVDVVNAIPKSSLKE